MTPVPFKDLSAHALRLRLYAGSVTCPDATVLLRGRAEHGDLEVHASVIGASHVMEVRSGSLALTELLACAAPEDAQPLAWWQPGDSAVEYAAHDAVRYRFDAQVMDLERARATVRQLRGMIRRADRSPSEIGLAHGFPSGSNGLWTAEPLVWAAVRLGGVVARTAHSYPSEGLVALSESSIVLPSREKAAQRALAVAV